MRPSSDLPQSLASGGPTPPSAETSARAIEDAFKEFTTREDIAVVLINQYVRWQPFGWSLFVPHVPCQIADVIRGLVDSYTKPVPAVLEIPSKDR